VRREQDSALGGFILLSNIYSSGSDIDYAQPNIPNYMQRPSLGFKHADTGSNISVLRTSKQLVWDMNT
jgi:hypothetical protein